MTTSSKDKVGTATIYQSGDWVMLDCWSGNDLVDALRYCLPASAWSLKYLSGRMIIGVRSRWTKALRQIADDLFAEVRVSSNIRVGKQNEAWKERYERWKSPHTKYLEHGIQTKVETAFSTLHVRPDAPPSVIKAAYRALAKLHHSDAGGDDSHMARINRAMEILKSEGIV